MLVYLKKLTIGLCGSILEIPRGRPSGIIDLLSTYPQNSISLDLTACISASSVPRWHEFGFPKDHCTPLGTLNGWRSGYGGSWDRFAISRQEYTHFCLCEITSEWSCDITDINGFSNSKSELSSYISTDELVESKSRELINEITPENLKKNLLHPEIRIIHCSKTNDHFARFLWDGRLWLMNDGGSHHTAAAKYISARLGQSVRLTGELRTYSLNESAIASLRHDFEMFVISYDSEFYNNFFDQMEAYKATWLSHGMPHPYNHYRVILLPRTCPRSMKVSIELHKASVLDLGKYLSELSESQQIGKPRGQISLRAD